MNLKKKCMTEEDLKEQTIRDPLTGVFNRRYFNQVIEQELYRSARYSHPIGFLMIDVDRFKEINDSFGHQVGDKVLQAVAKFLRNELRTSDVIIRYGGDEFLIMLLETNGQTESVKRRLEQRFASDPTVQGLVSFPLTLSIGSAHWEPTTSKPIEEILAEADQKMYEEKRKHQAGYR
jgi:diguanylate cyclase (GGDEF)-like protein